MLQPATVQNFDSQHFGQSGLLSMIDLQKGPASEARATTKNPSGRRRGCPSTAAILSLPRLVRAVIFVDYAARSGATPSSMT
jgi:hypothetical protein